MVLLSCHNFFSSNNSVHAVLVELIFGWPQRAPGWQSCQLVSFPTHGNWGLLCAFLHKMNWNCLFWKFQCHWTCHPAGVISHCRDIICWDKAWGSEIMHALSCLQKLPFSFFYYFIYLFLFIYLFFANEKCHESVLRKWESTSRICARRFFFRDNDCGNSVPSCFLWGCSECEYITLYFRSSCVLLWNSHHIVSHQIVIFCSCLLVRYYDPHIYTW